MSGEDFAESRVIWFLFGCCCCEILSQEQNGENAFFTADTMCFNVMG